MDIGKHGCLICFWLTRSLCTIYEDRVLNVDEFTCLISCYRVFLS